MNENENESKVIEQITDAVTEKTVKRVLDELKSQEPLRKQIFGDVDNLAKSEKQELAEQKAAGAEYIRKMARKESTKGLSAGTSTAGAELVPTIVSSEIITVAQKYGLVRQKASKWPMQSINENIPTLSSISAFRLTSDTAKITSSVPTSGTVNLRAKTVGVLIPVSKVLLQNANADLMTALNMLAGKAIAKIEDKWGMVGLAAGEGIQQNASVPVVTMASGSVTYAAAQASDLLSMIDATDENFYGERMGWVMSLSMLNNFRRLRSVVGTDKQGFLFENFGGQMPGTMWDIPFDTNAVMQKNSDGSQNGKACVNLVNWDNIIHGDAMEYQMEISDQATITDTDGSTLINLFEQNMVALKVWGLVDIQLSNAGLAHAVLKTSAS